MKAIKWFLSINFLIVTALTFTGCQRHRCEVVDDTYSAGRYMSRGINRLGGKHGDSRQVQSRDEFMSTTTGQYEEDFDFEPLRDQEGNAQLSMSESAAPQSKYTPGDPGSPVPGIDQFKDPSSDPQLANVFQKIYFSYDSNLIKDPRSIETIHNIADYMKNHTNVYIFVEGHCDERGAEAYNLSLGSRRCNTVRNTLIKEGVNPDQIYTISYGRERPLALGHNEDAWSQNRRAQFKVYQH